MVYVFLAEGFEEIEAISPIDILRRGGVEVKTVGVKNSAIKGAHNITFNTDIRETDIDYKELEAVVLPGGMPGTANLEKSKAVLSAIEYAKENGKLICAICAAPSVIGKMGLLKGKKAICYPGFEKYLKGAQISEQPVVTDGNIITAKGPGAASEFGFSILKAIKGESISSRIKKDMQYL
ncbi:MAG: DJ-1/PfpI family protein [Clostridia bacterium]|nr:DJ-1/PfpI family protein [Clostridia bacterium]